MCANGGPQNIASGEGEPCDLSLSGCYHGTMVAGVAAGHDANAPGGELSGVARGASIASFRVTVKLAGQFMSFALVDLQAALDYINSHLSTVPLNTLAAVNVSLRYLVSNSRTACGTTYPQVKNATDTLRSHNIAVVGATGNDGYNDRMAFPACIPGVIAVGATTKSDQVWVQSNYASDIDLHAPGTGQTNANPAPDGIFLGMAALLPGQPSTTAYSDHFDDGNGTYYYNVGTSLAAPHVAGAFAVLRQAVAGSTVDSNLSDLKRTATAIQTTRSGGVVVNALRININLAADKTPPTAPTNVKAEGTSSGITVTWTASTDANNIKNYSVFRRAAYNASWGSAYATVTSSPFSETVSSGTAYEYYVVANDNAGNSSANSASDIGVAVAFTEDPVGSTFVYGRHMSQLRQAIDGLRAFTGLNHIWTDYSPLTGPILASVYTDNSTGIIPALNGARTVLGLGNFAYHNRPDNTPVPTPASNGLILSDHVQQIRDAVR
jgi:hypothetical protein